MPPGSAWTSSTSPNSTCSGEVGNEHPRNDVDEVDGLARVKLSSAIEPGDLRVTSLVSELGGTVLDYLEDAGEVDHRGFALGQELAYVDPGHRSSEQPRRDRPT